MSRRGNCYDNAPMESFFKSYKTEEAQQIYETHEHATRRTTLNAFTILAACTRHWITEVQSSSSKRSKNRYSSARSDPHDAPITFPLGPIHCQLFVAIP
ncbi:hypothetical protein Poly59_34650 [Rubripirellula reticaptiva]|uniref:Integrase catalytic domain-containing protein n=2 Tax=Rubripirellula reticaptiva TaxID=2528013 RepID=A0A5C6EUA3_9BACT|nr:hypothetical protein Poly59_34650 [Rubripirellula reticaptiva]